MNCICSGLLQLSLTVAGATHLPLSPPHPRDGIAKRFLTRIVPGERQRFLLPRDVGHHALGPHAQCGHGALLHHTGPQGPAERGAGLRRERRRPSVGDT
eukprot:gene626-biopygen1858